MGRTRRSGAPRLAAALGVAAVVVAVGTSIEGAGAGPTTTTTAPTTTARPTTTRAPLPEPESEDVDPVRRLVPSIVVAPDVLARPEQRQPVVAAALAEPRNAIAVEDQPGTLCAVVRTSASVMAAGRWERNGEPLASSELLRRDPPGFGHCYIRDDGETLDDGVYQYVAVGATGARSAAATLVVGAASAAVFFVNNGDSNLCLVQASPTAADFFESFNTDGPLRPGQAIAIRLARVEQDVRVFGCPPDDVLRSFQLTPQGDGYVALFDPAEPTATDGGATTTTPRATTTTTT